MPASPEQSAYEILGVPTTATLDEVKKRYRELARQLHPDVNQNNPAASRQFTQVTQAYKTLSDPDNRRVYDAEQTLREQKAKQAAARSASPAPGYAAQSGGASAANRVRPAATNPGSESSRLTGEARAAFLRDRPVEARTLAEQAIRLNRRNADAWEVLGDVFRRQGKSEEAVNAYSMSLQINPRNSSVMQRLERMARAAGPASAPRPAARPSAPPSNAPRAGGGAGAYRGPSAQYGNPSPNVGAFRANANASGRISRLQDPDKRPLAKLLTCVVGYGIVAFLIFYVALYHGDAPINAPLPLLSWVSQWNGTIVTVLALTGLVLGATMTISGAIRRIDDELILSGVSGRAGTFLPLGLLMIVLSVLNFYIAAAVYAIVTALQESFTQSMLRVFSAVFIVTSLLAAAYVPNHVQVFLFGGNVVFITFVIGWLLGDFFRPEFD